jgi:diguanylate cyclase
MSDDANRSSPLDPTGVQANHTISENSALDLAAALLRAYGRYGIATDNASANELEERCEQWARHLLIGTPPPQDEGSAAVTAGQRLWEGARRFFTATRRHEQEFINSRIHDLRDMLWMFIQGIRATFVEDQAADKQVTAQLDQLKQAMDTDSIEILRREVVSSLIVIGRTIEERSKRQALQMQQLGDQIKNLREELVSTQQEMSLDSLTRIYNRSSFDEMLAKTTQLSLLSGQDACLVMVDLDDFKAINDNYGHPAGDAVLTNLARIMLRAYPRKTDFVARYAGDEFAIILQDTSAKEGLGLAERLLKTVSTTFIKLSDDQTIACTISLGVAAIQNGDTTESWLSRADAALYAAKEGGRNRVILQDGALLRR